MIGNASTCPATLMEIIAEHTHHGKCIVMVSKPTQRIVIATERLPRVAANGYRIRQAHHFAPRCEQAEKLCVKHSEVCIDELRAFMIDTQQISDSAHNTRGLNTIGFVEYLGKSIGRELPTQRVFCGRSRFLIVKLSEAVHQ